MALFRQNRRFIAWFACLALLLSSLAPAISHAMTSGQGNASLLMEICSATGNKSTLSIELDFQEPAGSKDSKTASMQHCPYCMTHAGSFALLHGAQPLIVTPNLSYALPELFYHAPHPLFAWAASHPRAPPLLS